MSLTQLPQLIPTPFHTSIVLLTILLSLPLLFLLITRGKERRTHFPPSPRRLPIIGNLHQLGSLPHRSLFSLSRKHGPLMLLQLGQLPTLVVSSADAAREVLKTHGLAFSSRPSLKVARQLLYQSRDLGFAPYGERWRHLRRVSVNHLLSATKVQSYRAAREDEVASMLEKISLSSSNSSTVNLSEEVSSFANNLTCRVVTGKSSREAGRNGMLQELTEETSELLGSFSVGDYWPALEWLDAVTGLDARVRKASKKWDEVLDEVIDEHARHDGNNNDFVDVLLSLQKDTNMDYTATEEDIDGLVSKDTNVDFTIMKEEIKGLVLDMFTAGTETSSVLLEWCMAELVQNSNVLKKLQEEVKYRANEKRTVKEEDLAEMKYLRAVVKETLRLHPPNPLLLPRESAGNIRMLGYEIPKGARVLINAWAIGRDPSSWESPEEFRPDRFMSSIIDFKGNDFQFIPFGSGRRICPGINFALSAVELALANLVYQFDWKLPEPMRAEDLDMTEASGLATHRKERLHLVATPISY